jgi:antirestriction protein ArdC
MPLRGSFLYEFSQASGNLSIRWRRQPCGYMVFNAEQIEGLPEIYYTRPEPKRTGPARIEHAESFFANIQADIRIRGARAYYAIDADYIAMPCMPRFA